MSQRKIRFIFIIASILLILVVLSFTGGLNISSFKQNYTKSLVASYTVLAGETVKKIEYAVKYGKPLTNFYGIEELLREINSDKASPIKEVQIIKTDGTIIYTELGAANRKLEADLQKQAIFDNKLKDQQNQSYISVLFQKQYHIYLPIYDKQGKWIGNLGLIFDESVIKARTDVYLTRLLQYIGFMAIASAICLILFISNVSILTKTREIRKTRLLIFIFIILGVVQIVYGSLNYVMLKEGYLEIVKENTSLVLKVIKRDVASVIDKGVPYTKLYGIGDYMNKMIYSVPEIERISIMDTNFTSEKLDDKGYQSQYTFSEKLVEDKMGKGNYIAVVDLSQSYIDGKMLNILLDTVTVAVITFLLMVEVTLFVLFFLKRQVDSEKEYSHLHQGDAESIIGGSIIGVTDTNVSAGTPLDDRSIIRPLAFIVFTSLFMSTAFIPVLMKELYQPVFGLSKNLVVGLPISTEMLFVAIASILAGYMTDKKGWKPVFLWGISIMAAGTFLSGIAWDPISFIISRGFVGMGFGFAVMAMQAFTISAGTEEAKNEAITALNSGAYAGINCGVVVGAMLADKIGFSEVFFVAFFIILLAIGFAMKFMANLVPQRIEEATVETVIPVFLDIHGSIMGNRIDKKKKAPKARSSLLHFFSDANILIFFVLILIPISICGMFLYYFFPLYAEGKGVSPSDIGRAFLLNGLCIVYFGPILSKYSDKLLGTKMSVVLSSAIVATALIIFAVNASIPTAIIAVVLLGIAEGFGITAQINYYLSRKAAVKLGEGKSMGYYGLVENFGQMLGPVMFGMAAILGIAQGVGLISMIFITAIFIFFLATGNRTRMKYKRSIGGLTK